LPGKVLMPLFETQSVLEVMLSRLAPSIYLDLVVVATTTDVKDDAIVALCEQLSVPCFRGSETDVLDRYYQAAKAYGATDVVRLTADCPLQDYEVVDRLIESYLNSDVDYAANAMTPTYPDGFDAEIFSFTVLEKVWNLASRPSDREHVTPYLHRHSDQFRLANVAYDRDVSQMRLTLDEPRDFEVISQAVNGLFGRGYYVHLTEILAYMEAHAEVGKLNGSIIRNEGYLKSIENE